MENSEELHQKRLPFFHRLNFPLLASSFCTQLSFLLFSLMNTNLLLAEALDLLKKSQMREQQLDILQEKIARSAKRHRELSKLKNEYSSVYDNFIRGLEMVNFVRRSAMGLNEDLTRFCADKMIYFMNHCDKLREKETNILVPIDEADEITKSGFHVEQTLKLVETVLSRGQPFVDEVTLGDGCFEFIVKNLDDYSVASPTIHVALQVGGAGAVQVFRKEIPSQCGWCKFVGSVGRSSVRVLVGTDGFLRKSHATVEIRQLAEIPAGGDWLGKLPKIDESELTMLTLAHLPVDDVGVPAQPRDPMEELTSLRVPFQSSPTAPNVKQPIGTVASIEDRLEAIQRAVAHFPRVSPQIKSQLAVDVSALPEPTDIFGDLNVCGDFDVTAADLEQD
jgi:hypothetical protein